MPDPQPISADDLKQTREELLAAMRQELGPVRQEIEAVRDQVRQRPEPEPPARPVETLEQIQQLVDAGTLTPMQGQARITAMQTATMKEELRRELTAERTVQERGTKIRAEIQRYQQHVPAVMQQGTPERARVTKEFTRLQELGYPNDTSTELLALRATFGDATAIEERTADRRPTHEESTAGAGAPESGASGGSPPGVPTRLRAHYEKMIGQGMYTGWDDANLKAELKRAVPAKKVAA